MQRQYREIKEKHKEYLLFFRLGDFYELFYEDAEIASKELGLILTARHKNTEQNMPMCGVPYHSVDKYIAKLTKGGFKIAICEQVSDPKLPGIVKREVARIITPGTTFQDEVLESNKNNYLLAITEKNNVFGIAFTDLTTGEFLVTEVESFEELKTEFFRIQPAEALLSSKMFSAPEIKKFFVDELKISVSIVSKEISSEKIIKEHFGTQSLQGLGLNEKTLATDVSAMLISYLNQTQKTLLKHIRKIRFYETSEYMHIDTHSIRNLELFYTNYEGEKEGTLFHLLNMCQTAAGSRLLRTLILKPILNQNTIHEKQNAVDEIISNSVMREGLKILQKILDIERIISKISLKRANARDMIALKTSLKILPDIRALLTSVRCKELLDIYNTLNDSSLEKVVNIIEKSIQDDPPVTLTEGGIIKSGFHKELDEIRKISRGGKEWLKKYEEEEKEKTGIKSLKIGFNKVFGYYIEISKGQITNAPEEYIRKQTLTNAERFITPILKNYEEKVLDAEEKLHLLEYELFQELCEEVVKYLPNIQETAQKLAHLDVFYNFAVLAIRNNYCRPKILEEGDIKIQNGRHPVIEKSLKEEIFVPNDTFLSNNQSIILLTGPNMAGKSTYLRQTALIVLMAHIGGYVPADSAEIPLCDRIFTRIGASDNLSKGQSTFMVEMQETANILHNSTDKSLLILDEIGRGTSTYDGLSLAWAVFEYIHDTLKSKTLFATHYHEMVDLAENLQNAKNYCMTVTEKTGKVIFLHKVIEGGVDKSYGIEVAKLAGIPSDVINRAKKVLSELESSYVDDKIIKEHEMGQKESKNSIKQPREIESGEQLSFLVPRVVEKVIVKGEKSKMEQELKKLDIEKITPMEALLKLHEWKKH